MRLCIVHINAEQGSEPYTAEIESIFSRVKRPDTVLEHRYAHLKRAADTVFTYPYTLNSIDVLHQLAEAGDQGFDGAMVACSGDPGVPQARSLCDIPIVGPFAATLHLAAMYGYKIGVVTVEDRAWAETCEMIVESNGFASRCVGVQRISIPSKEAFTIGFTDPEVVAKEIERQASVLVERGASAVVLGSAGLSCIASTAGLSEVADSGAPIFDTLSVGLKTLEMRVDLSRALGLPVTSRVGSTTRIAPDDAARVRRLFAL